MQRSSPFPLNRLVKDNLGTEVDFVTCSCELIYVARKAYLSKRIPSCVEPEKLFRLSFFTNNYRYCLAFITYLMYYCLVFLHNWGGER